MKPVNILLRGAAFGKGVLSRKKPPCVLQVRSSFRKLKEESQDLSFSRGEGVRGRGESLSNREGRNSHSARKRNWVRPLPLLRRALKNKKYLESYLNFQTLSYFILESEGRPPLQESPGLSPQVWSHRRFHSQSLQVLCPGMPPHSSPTLPKNLLEKFPSYNSGSGGAKLAPQWRLQLVQCHWICCNQCPPSCPDLSFFIFWLRIFVFLLLRHTPTQND